MLSVCTYVKHGFQNGWQCWYKRWLSPHWLGRYMWVKASSNPLVSSHPFKEPIYTTILPTQLLIDVEIKAMFQSFLWGNKVIFLQQLWSDILHSSLSFTVVLVHLIWDSSIKVYSVSLILPLGTYSATEEWGSSIDMGMYQNINHLSHF